VLFQRGHFDAHAVKATAEALSAYALGLPAFVGVKVLAPAFYARQDTRTPVKVGIAAVAANLVLTLSLSIPFAHVGNALATTAASWINALSLAYLLRRRGHFAVDTQSRRRVPRILAACAGMTIFLYGLEKLLHGLLYQGNEIEKLLSLTALIVLGMAAYAALVLAFGAADIAQLRSILQRRKRRTAPVD
jgi:putative peptidoglycan lipid II flippase